MSLRLMELFLEKNIVVSQAGWRDVVAVYVDGILQVIRPEAAVSNRLNAIEEVVGVVEYPVFCVSDCVRHIETAQGLLDGLGAEDTLRF